MRVIRFLPRRPALLALLVLGACVPPNVDPAALAEAPSTPVPTVASGRHDLITARELETIGASTLYEAVAKLRPNFLKPRTGLTHGKPDGNRLMLYVDGERMESVDDLRRLSLSEVMEVRFYEPQIANLRFARYNNAAGAIAVRLKLIE